MAQEKKKMDKDTKEKCSLLTDVFRINYPNLFEPKEVKKGDGKPKYGLVALGDKTKFDIKKVQLRVRNAIIHQWGPDPKKWPKPIILPFRDGDIPYGEDQVVKPEDKGMWVIKASSSAAFGRPKIFDIDNTELENKTKIYSGCYCQAFIRANPYTYLGKSGVNFILNGTRFYKDGPSLGGGLSVTEMFGDPVGSVEDEFGEDDFMNMGNDSDDDGESLTI